LNTLSVMRSQSLVMENPLLHPFAFIYQLIQWVLSNLFSPDPPKPGAKLGRPKIAIIGAGLTGVSAASHCVGHGFDVQIFEAGPRKQLGGIWSVNSTLHPLTLPEVIKH
jgi:hypothetical protein